MTQWLMDDLIYRRAAIDLVKSRSYDLSEREDEWAMVQDVEELPSAQPVLTCDGCRHVGTYDTDFPCNGCVRREKDYYDPEQ